MEYDFRFYFNKRKQSIQWVDVFLWDVHPNTFERWEGGRWGYFLATWEHPYKDKFGELHFVKSRLRFDAVYHELRHLAIEWFWSNGISVDRKNEEKLVSFEDKIANSFRRGLAKAEPKIKL